MGLGFTVTDTVRYRAHMSKIIGPIEIVESRCRFIQMAAALNEPEDLPGKVCWISRLIGNGIE